MTDFPLPISDYTEFDSYEEAMEELIAAMTEPWPWNLWTKFSAALAPSYPDADRNPRYRAALRKTLMEKKFGPRWQKPNPLREKALETLREEEGEDAEGTVVPVAGVEESS